MSGIGNISSNFGSITSSSLDKISNSIGKSENTTGFTDRLENALNNVADAQKQSSELAKAYELGSENDLSKVMISQQVSSLGFQFTLNARNKVLSAYKDIMNMPV